MTKAEIVERVASSSAMTKTSAAKVLNALMSAIKDALVNGDKVKLAGLGNFSVVQRQAKRGRNPKTGEIVDIPAKSALRFTPAKQLKQAIL